MWEGKNKVGRRNTIPISGLRVWDSARPCNEAALGLRKRHLTCALRWKDLADGLSVKRWAVLKIPILTWVFLC